MNQVIEFFKKAGMFYIATMDKNQPRVRPFGGLLLYNGRIYFNTNSTKKVFRQMMDNSKVELCAFYQGTWMRVQAAAVRDTKEEVKRAMMQEQPGVKKLYEGKEDIFEIFYLDEAIVTMESFGREPEIFTLQKAMNQ